MGGVIFAKAFECAGLPASVFNMLLTDIDDIGDEILKNSIPSLISFTGSTAVSAILGNSLFVDLADTDVDQAVNVAVFEKFI